MIMAEDIIESWVLIMAADLALWENQSICCQLISIQPNAIHSVFGVGLRWLRLAFSTHPQTWLEKQLMLWGREQVGFDH